MLTWTYAYLSILAHVGGLRREYCTIRISNAFVRISEVSMAWSPHKVNHTVHSLFKGEKKI